MIMSAKKYVGVQTFWFLGSPTLQVEEDVGLVILEHLGHQLNIHVLDIDVLHGVSVLLRPTRSVLRCPRTWRLLFMTTMASLSFSW